MSIQVACLSLALSAPRDFRGLCASLATQISPIVHLPEGYKGAYTINLTSSRYARTFYWWLFERRLCSVVWAKYRHRITQPDLPEPIRGIVIPDSTKNESDQWTNALNQTEAYFQIHRPQILSFDSDVTDVAWLHNVLRISNLLAGTTDRDLVGPELQSLVVRGLKRPVQLDFRPWSVPVPPSSSAPQRPTDSHRASMDSRSPIPLPALALKPAAKPSDRSNKRPADRELETSHDKQPRTGATSSEQPPAPQTPESVRTDATTDDSVDGG